MQIRPRDRSNKKCGQTDRWTDGFSALYIYIYIYRLASIPALRAGGVSHTIAPLVLSREGGMSHTIAPSALS